jgi:diaminopimelate decarboxylase
MLLLEPGRWLVGDAGVLLTRVEYLKRSPAKAAIVDAAMNDLIRPALYAAWPAWIRCGRAWANPSAGTSSGRLRGADFLAHDRALGFRAGRPRRDPLGGRVRDVDELELQRLSARGQ